MAAAQLPDARPVVSSPDVFKREQLIEPLYTALIGVAPIIVYDVAGTASNQHIALGVNDLELRATHEAGQQRLQPPDTDMGTIIIGLVVVAVQPAAHR